MNHTIKLGDDVTLHLHGLKFEAEVTGLNPDGSVDLTAVSKFGADFAKHRVMPMPADGIDPSLPYWTEEQ